MEHSSGEQVAASKGAAGESNLGVHHLEQVARAEFKFELYAYCQRRFDRNECGEFPRLHGEFISSGFGCVSSGYASPQVALLRTASGPVASQSRPVASEFPELVASVPSSPLGALPSPSPVSPSVVASSSPQGESLMSSIGSLGPVELIGRRLRQRRVVSRSVELRCFQLRSQSGASPRVESSPRSVLRQVFQALAETARDNVSRRMSRRLGRMNRVSVVPVRVKCPRTVESSVARPVEHPASAARPWRLH